jgi:hypothetical protein
MNMKNFIMLTLLGLTVFSFGVQAASAAQVSIGIRIGPPPPPHVVYVAPASPGPEFVWVAGYWYPVGRNWRWHAGYWTRPPVAGVVWYAPRYEGGKYFAGYWVGERVQIAHDHHWDKHRDRDYHGKGR